MTDMLKSVRSRFNEMDERRQNPRIAIAFPVECNLFFYFLPSKKYSYTVTKDLSQKGARIISEEFLPKGDLVKVNINFIDRMVNLKARVAWCNKDKAPRRYYAGLEFMEVNDESRKELADFLGYVLKDRRKQKVSLWTKEEKTSESVYRSL